MKNLETNKNLTLEMASNSTGTYYSVLISSNEFEKLLAIQTYPSIKYFFRNKEIEISELVVILESK